MGTTNNLINATINCDCFIVPNAATRADQRYSMGIQLAKKAAEIAANNGFEYNEATDKFVQMWWTNSDISDNFQDHGFNVHHEGKIYRFGHDIILDYIPETFFRDHKEGDILPITIRLKPNWYTTENDKRNIQEDDLPEFNVTFNLKLNQLDYRYRRFGTFEEVLKAVC